MEKILKFAVGTPIFIGMVLLKLLGWVLVLFLEFWREIIGYVLIACAGIALAFIFPWILILYALIAGMALINR